MISFNYQLIRAQLNVNLDIGIHYYYEKKFVLKFMRYKIGGFLSRQSTGVWEGGGDFCSIRRKW